MAVVSASNEAIGLFVNSPVFQVNVGQGAAVASLPRELPPACAHFVDRSAERGLLEDACADSASTKVVVVDGIPGVGKSALVKKWGNEKRIDHFPDGQIYLDFAASEEGGASPVADMLRSKLSQMIGPDAVSRTRPSDLPAQYRSFTCDKSILVVLENVSSYSEIEPFVPNSPSSLVLATSSRIDIDSLETEITHVSLGELDVDDSLDLFVRVAYGLSGEEAQQVLPPDEVEEIQSVLEHCFGIPLAIRACASILWRKRASSAKELHRKLMRSEQDVFCCREMDEVWRECCKALDPRCLDAARRFASLPVPTASLGTLAAVWGTDPSGARSIVEELHCFGFVSLDSPADGVGDASLSSEVTLLRVIRAYLQAQMLGDGSLGEVQESVHALLLSHFRVLSQELDHSLKPARLRLYDRIPSNDLVRDILKGRTEFEVFESESGLLGAVPQIINAHQGVVGDAWAIGDALWSFYSGTFRYQAGSELFSACSRSARQAGNILAASRLTVMSSGMEAKLGKAAEALGSIDAAIVECAPLGRLDVMCMFHEFRGICLAELGCEGDAVAEFTYARAGNESLGNKRGCSIQDLLLSRTYRRFGKAEEAEKAARRSLDEVDKNRDWHTYAKSAQELCFALRSAGKHGEALAYGKDAAEIFAELGEYRRAHDTLFAIAESLHALADDDDAEAFAAEVRDYYERVGLSAEYEQVSRFLESLHT
ncbi:tetratricopeptide repeat protein [Gordonibacter sp. RACS_AR49]|uniref:tetratricopeptide repeat protein n=1 Tax=Gordonibacter sp. RACS_AR49 TaxID=2871986 RepID=UPI00262F18F4|nr:tetratricopeptide repeat protein [Gordonibacter sp. RACS_AR49]MDN4509333.1 tetratricopeptide repeat protein [Gordonibacter sp. RACS_AR49]